MQSFKAHSTERDFSDTLNLLTDLNPGRVLVAFSGGCDSLVLLSLCVRTLGKDNVTAVYVNHRIRPEGELEKEIILNKRNCEILGVGLVIKDLGKDSVIELSRKRKCGLEEAARILRYEALHKARKENDCSFILTAHHQDDQIETILMRIIRHSPLSSLCGIPYRTGCVVRPLLDISRRQIEDYASENGLKFSTDSTNSDTDIERNDIRLNIIPRLSDVMPDFRRRLLEISCRSRALLEGFEVPESILKGYVPKDVFLNMNELQKTRTLFCMWDNLIDGELPQSLMRRVISSSQRKTSALESSNGGSFTVTDDRIILTRDVEDFSLFSCRLEKGLTELVPDLVLDVSQCGEKDTLFLPASYIEDHIITVRFACEDDQIVLRNGTKKVFRLLQDQKIPSCLRTHVPVLVEGGEVIAVLCGLYGVRDRVCQRLVTCLAPDRVYYYIKLKGNLYV